MSFTRPERASATAASAVTIDLAAKDRVGEDERQVAKDIIIAGMALAANPTPRTVWMSFGGAS